MLKEHSKTHALKIANYACASQSNFKKLMQCFLDDEYRLAQRAAWSVNWAARKKPEMIVPHIKELVSVLHKKNVHNSVVRNSVRVLQDIDIPEAFHGEVMDACFQFLENPSTPVAIKAFSLTILFNLSRRYPEIKPKLKLIIEDCQNQETPGIQNQSKQDFTAAL